MIDEKRLAEIDKRLRKGSENGDDVKYIRMLVTELQRELAEARGCFDAAFCEGWNESVAEGDIERIRDLWNRRLIFAYYALTAPPAPQTREGDEL